MVVGGGGGVGGVQVLASRGGILVQNLNYWWKSEPEVIFCCFPLLHEIVDTALLFCSWFPFQGSQTTYLIRYLHFFSLLGWFNYQHTFFRENAKINLHKIKFGMEIENLSISGLVRGWWGGGGADEDTTHGTACGYFLESCSVNIWVKFL